MLNPSDIKNKKFSKQMISGYNVEEVDLFLEKIVEDYTEKIRQLEECQNKVIKLKAQLDSYQN